MKCATIQIAHLLTKQNKHPPVATSRTVQALSPVYFLSPGEGDVRKARCLLRMGGVDKTQ